LGKHLHKDTQGRWRITFRDEELKVARRNGHSNLFDLSFPEALVPLLEEYLATWRPILQAIADPSDQHVFLSRYGKPYTDRILRQTTKHIVYRYTGKDFHPHIIRTVWATEHIRKTNDFYGAAVMLNDTLETVTSTYAHLQQEDIAEKIDRLIDERLSQGK
jgi:site-specific recombinase XerC